MPNKKIIFTLIALAFLIFACQPSGPTAEQIAETMVAETAAAVPTSEPPTATPTATVEPTNTPLPPSPTPTPAPLVIMDDFSSESDIWGDCEKCEWKDGELYFGPYPAKGGGVDQIFYVICEACGKPTYYRIAADVTFFEGHGGDRTFGLLAGLTDNNFIGAGTITTHQHVLYETFDFNTQQWGGSPFELFKSAVLYGAGATNHIEITVKPTVPRNSVEIVVYVNGEKTITYKQGAEPVQVGLYLGWHSVGIKYDNFEFEEFLQ